MTHIEYLHSICIACQKCCKTIAMDTQYPYEPDVIEFYEMRGFKVSMLSNGTCRLATENLPCPHLVDSGCSVYANRPEVCRIFDGSQFPDIDCAWNDFFKSLGISSYAQFVEIYKNSTDDISKL